MTRAFVAVRLPDIVLDAVADRISELSVPGRSTTRDEWHLTLQFLGNDADIGAVARALDGLDTVGGRARVGGAGAFPDARHAQVLWLGLIEGAETVARLAEAVAARTGALGHAADPRAFQPHITIARCRLPTDLRATVEAVGDEPVGPTWDVDAVTVYESERLPEGARYTARATIPLRPGPLRLGPLSG